MSTAINTYSANALGNTVNWNGQTFDIGPATVSVDDEVMASGSPPITLPEGNYTSIEFLASCRLAAARNSQHFLRRLHERDR